jgi:hypothetical protein
MKFSELIDGDFPPEYRKIYFERAKHELAKADKFVNVTIDKRKYAWAGDGEYVVTFKWNVSNTCFDYYDLLSIDEKDQLSSLANKALKKLDKEFEALEGILTPDKSFEVRVDWSLLFVLTRDGFKYGFEKWLKNAVGARYHYLNSREYLKKINSLHGQKQRDAMYQYSKDVRQTVELIKHLKEFE